MASSLRDEISRLELLHAAHPDGLVFPHLADAYRRAGRYSQAESLLDAGLRRHAEYSSAHVVLGRLRLDQGKREEAEDAFRRVLRLDPHNQVALEQLAEIAAGKGRLKEAVSLFRRLSRITTDEALLSRVDALERQIAGGAGALNGQPAPVDRSGGNGGSRTGPYAQAAPAMLRPPVGEAQVDADAGAAAPLPEPGEVVTETMAELYARQGLEQRAAAVYRQLLERSPGDSRLRGKLEEVERAVRREPAQTAAAPDRTVSIRDELNAVLAWSRAPADPPVPAVRPDTPAAAARDPARQPAEGDQAGAAAAAQTGRSDGPALEVSARELPPAESIDGDSSPDSAGPELFAQQNSAPEPSAPEPSAPKPYAPKPYAPEHSTAEPSAPKPYAPEPSVPEPAPEPSAPEPSVAGPAVATGEAEGRALPAAAAEEQRVAAADPLADAPAHTKSLIALTDMLVGLLEYRDPFFRGSSSLTRLLATSVAEEMDLPVDDRVDLALAAVLRDVGRLALGGKLVAEARITPSREARRLIERHVDLALHLMEGIELPKAVRSAVRHHHERWDGAGYPDALATHEIPVLARILAVVDSFAAMVSPRPYRLPRKVPEAAAELQEEAGTRYDPEVVNALIRVLARREQPHLGFVQRHHILMVNPDQPGAVVSAAKLCSAGYLAEVAVDAAAARERLRRVPVAALIISAECGAEATAALIREVRVDEQLSGLPIVVSEAAGVALRVRLLEMGADVCFPPGVRHAELQGTVGALVRRTLRPRPARDGSAASPDAPWLALHGDIQDFPLTWLLQVMKYDSRTAAIGIRGARGEGAIYLRTGDAVHAQIRGGASGEAALRQMLQWEKGRFTVQPDARPNQQTITTSIMHLLLAQAVDEDHAAAGIFGAVSAGG